MTDITGKTPLNFGQQTITDLKKILGINNFKYKKACLIGSSSILQHFTIGSTSITGSQGYLNWSNWAIGSPFDFCQNLGASGDVSVNIFSRGWQVHPDVDTVFISPAINDVSNFSQSATQGQIDAEIDRLIGVDGIITTGLLAFKNSGINVCLISIHPLNGLNTSTDTRIVLMDAINTWILDSKNAGRCDEVIDGFNPLWDDSQPLIRQYKPIYTYDGVHLTNAGGQAVGLLESNVQAVKNMYLISNSGSFKYKGSQNTIPLLGMMRTVSGITSTISYGSGVLASGWRALGPSAGTPTVILSNSQDYDISNNYVGSAAFQKTSEKWQKAVITNAVAGTDIKFQLATPIIPTGGDEFFHSVDIYVESSIGIKTVMATSTAFFTSGTSPADQPYGGSTTYVKTVSNSHSSAQAEVEYSITSFRIFLDSQPCRVPENINGTQALSLNTVIEFIFGNTGEAVIYFSRPSLWRKIAG